MATDQDSSGRAAAARAWGLLVDAGATDPRGVRLTHKDPAEVLRHDGAEALREAVLYTNVPLLADVVEHRLEEWRPVLDHIDDQLGALRALAPDIERATPEQQDHATAQLLVALDLDADLIHAELENPEEAGGGDDAADADTTIPTAA